MRRQRKVLILVLVALFLFATFPGKGGLEGDQREIPLLSNRTDNWGFIFPFLIGQWPNLFGHWRFTFTLLQLIAFWIGLWLLFRNRKLSLMLNRVFWVVVFVSSVFVSQLWRDSSLLALSTFGFGLLTLASQSAGMKRYIFGATSIFVLHVAALFKILYGPVLAILVLWILYQIKLTKKGFVVSSVVLAISLSIYPFFADKLISEKIHLKKVFPEQQPMIFDLASNYCWGQSDGIIDDAQKGLQIVLKPGFPMPTVCASLHPNSWDNLHASNRQWQYSSPISRIVGNNQEKMNELRTSWIRMIVNNPVDWLQVRMMYLGSTLILSNSFVPQNDTNTWHGFFGEINKWSWVLFFSFASTLDKFRVTSPLFFLILFTFLILRYSLGSQRMKDKFMEHNVDFVFAFLVLLATISITMFGFVASNGRYVFPYISLIYLFLLRSKIFLSPIQV